MAVAASVCRCCPMRGRSKGFRAVTTSETIVDQIESAKDPEEIVRLWEQSRTLDQQSRWRALWQTLDVLKGLEYPAFSRFLVELALTEKEHDSWIQEFLSDWLDEQPEERRVALRASVIGDFAREIDPPGTPERAEASLWSLIHIGFRT